MKLRRICSFLMSAILLAGLLTACRTQPMVESPGPEGSAASSQHPNSLWWGKTDNPPSDDPEISQPPESAEPTPEPSKEPDLWDPSHRLPCQFTPARGLELPIQGATGYASVKLPLWELLPEEEQGKLVTIYNPEPEPSPDPEPSTEPAPEAPSAEPVEPSVEPTTPAESAPQDSAAPQPTGPQDLEGTSVPLPGETPPAGEPAPQSAQEPPSQAPEPSQEAFVSAAPQPTPEPQPFPSQDPILPADPSQAASLPPEPIPSMEPGPESTLEPVPDPLEPTPEPTPEPDPFDGALTALEPGTAFTVLEESGDWWRVQAGENTGWVEHRYCLVNLPDVIPSIVYNASNAYSSKFVSCGKTIPNITGKALYHGAEYNPRLDRTEFMMPVLYSMARHVSQAQQAALAEGNTLVIYEGYRPYETQMAVVRNLTSLSRRDPEVRAGISTRPWSISWFIATGASNHQEGYAMDVSLAKITQAHTAQLGGASVVQIDEYIEYTMPTPIHELSMAAATYTSPVAIFSTTAWQRAEMAPAMAANEPAKALQRYCTLGGSLTPLASEWWHFNDLAAYAEVRAYPSVGDYEITQCLSLPPDQVW